MVISVMLTTTQSIAEADWNVLLVNHQPDDVARVKVHRIEGLAFKDQ